MACSNCSRQTLQSFIGGLTGINQFLTSWSAPSRLYQTHRHFSTLMRSYGEPIVATSTEQSTYNNSEERPLLSATARKPIRGKVSERPRSLRLNLRPKVPLVQPREIRHERPQWQVQKQALKDKFGTEAWSPRKKLSPDAMEGIRHLHKTQPDRFTTPILADYFKVSPEAIRRILKSKWRPSDEEQEERQQRWDKRGERIWANLVELGIKPPKKWREMGVGKAKHGDVPKWKTRWRNQVTVNDSATDDIIPTVDEVPKRVQEYNWKASLSERI